MKTVYCEKINTRSLAKQGVILEQCGCGEYADLYTAKTDEEPAHYYIKCSKCGLNTGYLPSIDSALALWNGEKFRARGVRPQRKGAEK